MAIETGGTHRELHHHHHHHEIHFSVDGEPLETHQREWTPNAIIREFGEKDPATLYLVRIEGHHFVSVRPWPMVESLKTVHSRL